MKKIKKILFLCMFCVLLTGCVKFNANMDIKKDKSMDFSIIYAVDTSLFGDESLFEDEQLEELKKQGYTVQDYSDGSMKGVVLSREIKNIDELSTTEDTEFDLSAITDSESDNKYIFKVEKGLFKNTYIARLKFDASDSDLTISNDMTTTQDDDYFEEEINEDDDFDLEWDVDDDEWFTEEEEDDDESDDLFENFDYSSIMSSMDLSFNVTLPYSAISSNASTNNNDSKELSWNLSSNELETIEFEFELYNTNTICITFGVMLLIIFILIIILIKNKKKNKQLNFTNIDKQNNIIKES